MSGQIYEKQAVTQIPQSSFRAADIKQSQVPQQMQAEAIKDEEKAFDMYERELDSTTMANMDMVYQGYQNDPKGLEKALGELEEKTKAGIVDNEEIRAKFTAGYRTQAVSYINKSNTNFKRVQRVKFEEGRQQALIDNQKAMGLAFSNLLSADANEADVVNYLRFAEDSERILSTKNEDGTLMFSPLQQESYRKQYKNLALNSAKNFYNELPDYEKENWQRDLQNGTARIFKGADENDDNVTFDLKDVIDAEGYNDLLDYTRKYKERQMRLLDMQEKQITFDTEQRLSEQLDDMPFEQALKALEENEMAVSPKYFKAKQRGLLSSMGISNETRADKATEFLLEISRIQALPDDKFIKAGDEILTNIENAYADGELALSDKRRLINNVNKQQSGAIENLKTDDKNWLVNFTYENANQYIEANVASPAQYSNVMLDYFRLVDGRDYSNAKKKEILAKIVNDNKNKALEKKLKENTLKNDVPSFKDVQQAQQAFENGQIKKGDRIMVNGVWGKV